MTSEEASDHGRHLGAVSGSYCGIPVVLVPPHYIVELSGDLVEADGDHEFHGVPDLPTRPIAAVAASIPWARCPVAYAADSRPHGRHGRVGAEKRVSEVLHPTHAGPTHCLSEGELRGKEQALMDGVEDIADRPHDGRARAACIVECPRLLGYEGLEEEQSLPVLQGKACLHLGAARLGRLDNDCSH